MCFQLGIGEVNSVHENSSEFFLSWEASEEYAMNEELDQKEEHECSPNDVSYHLVDEQCRKNSHKPLPRRDVLYHQDYHKAKNTSAYPPCAKHHRAANSHYNSDAEDNMEEPVDTPLSKADIPTILDAVLSNISLEGTSSRDGSQDISHLGE